MEHYLFVILLFLMYYLGLQSLGVTIFTIVSTLLLRFSFDKLFFWVSDISVNLFYIALSTAFMLK